MTKEELWQYSKLKEELKQLEEQIKDLRASAMFPSSQVITDMPMAPHSDNDKMAEIVSKLDELERLYMQTYDRYLSLKKTIENEIASLTDTSERRIMRLRYMHGLKWKEICTAVGYSWRQVHRIHKRALGKIVKESEVKNENVHRN